MHITTDLDLQQQIEIDTHASVDSISTYSYLVHLSTGHAAQLYIHSFIGFSVKVTDYIAFSYLFVFLAKTACNHFKGTQFLYASHSTKAIWQFVTIVKYTHRLK